MLHVHNSAIRMHFQVSISSIFEVHHTFQRNLRKIIFDRNLIIACIIGLTNNICQTKQKWAIILSFKIVHECFERYVQFQITYLEKLFVGKPKDNKVSSDFLIMSFVSYPIYASLYVYCLKPTIFFLSLT